MLLAAENANLVVKFERDWVESSETPRGSRQKKATELPVLVRLVSRGRHKYDPSMEPLRPCDVLCGAASTISGRPAECSVDQFAERFIDQGCADQFAYHVRGQGL